MRDDDNVMDLAAGDPAPDFELPADDGTTFRLSERPGGVVLYFYPKDDTSGCTVEAREFNEAGPELEALGYEVAGVSPDGAASHRRFREKHDLEFTLLCDPDHEVAQRYGAWGTRKLYGREYEGIIRSTFVIGPDGMLEAVYRNVRATGHAHKVTSGIEAAS